MLEKSTLCSDRRQQPTEAEQSRSEAALKRRLHAGMCNTVAPSQAGAACCKRQHLVKSVAAMCLTCTQPTTSHSPAVMQLPLLPSHPVRHLSIQNQHPTQLLLTAHLQTCAAPSVHNPLLLRSGIRAHNQAGCLCTDHLTGEQQPSSPHGSLWCW